MEREQLPMPEKKSQEDPTLFLADFRGSQRYINAYSHFYKGKTFSEDITEEEKKTVFERSQEAKVALVEFARDEENFHYNPALYPEDVQTSVDGYIQQVIKMREAFRSGDRMDIEGADVMRSTYHNAVAQAFFNNNLVPNVKMGRTFARLILVEQNLDTYDTALEPDVQRAKRSLSG